MKKIAQKCSHSIRDWSRQEKNLILRHEYIKTAFRFVSVDDHKSPILLHGKEHRQVSGQDQIIESS